MKRNFLTAAIGALLVGAGIGGNAQGIPLTKRRDDESYPSPVIRSGRHSRNTGKHQPAGSKLARKAAEGQLTIIRIR